MLHILELSTEEYTNSVIELFKLADSGGGSGSRTAAQVLLSAYNNNFMLNVPDLGYLDNNNYKHAMNVIHGRRNLMQEPHNCIENGGELFSKLCKDWERLNNNYRFKSLCSRCDGSGIDYEDEEDQTGFTCTFCKGTGYDD